MSIFGKRCLLEYEFAKPVEKVIPEYEVRKSIYFNEHTIMKVWYRDVSNCEGLKILVYQGRIEELVSGDPHFREDDGPIARFHPSQMGWSHAVLFVENL